MILVEARRTLFDKLKNMLGGAPAKNDQPATPARAYRPAKPRAVKRGANSGPRRGAPDGGPDEHPFGQPPARNARAAAEIACPNCGEPMLDGWGSTCGKCRPNLVSPKTIMPAAPWASASGRHMSGSDAMTLGWLLVIRCLDRSRVGTLLDLDHRQSVLSRNGYSSGNDLVIPFDDSYMSSAHAVVRRPLSGDRSDAFTIQDRWDPSPSVNGTFVNGHKLDPGEVVRLSDGDVIKLGATELLFKSLWLPGAAAYR